VGARWPGTLALAWAKKGGAACNSDDERCYTAADNAKKSNGILLRKAEDHKVAGISTILSAITRFKSDENRAAQN